MPALAGVENQLLDVRVYIGPCPSIILEDSARDIYLNKNIPVHQDLTSPRNRQRELKAGRFVCLDSSTNHRQVSTTP
jgi:hypothetical protein